MRSSASRASVPVLEPVFGIVLVVVALVVEVVELAAVVDVVLELAAVVEVVVELVVVAGGATTGP
jgi:hypothetical protein